MNVSAAAASAHFRQPQPLPEVAAALVGPNRFAKPVVFADIKALARHLSRARGDDALVMTPEPVGFRDRVRDMVAIHAEDQFGGRRRLIGHAWIGGRNWRVLEAALDAVRPARQFAHA